MTRYFLWICFVFSIFCLTSPVFGEEDNKVIEISISGLEDILLKNVQLSLSLFRHQSDSQLTDSVVKRQYNQADEEIRKALEPFGYYSATIDKNIFYEESVWHVDVRIDPGEPVRINKIDIDLIGPGKDDQSLQKSISEFIFPLKEGDTLNHLVYEQGKNKFSRILLASGYRDASYAKSSVRVNKQDFSARVYLTIDSGPKYRFGKTHFDADFISPGLLNRMLPYTEGEPFSPRKIIQMRQALYNSDYFSQVDVKSGDALPGTLEIPIFVRLKPKQKNKFGVGVGYGTDTGARGSLEWTNRLLNRYGHQFNILLQPSERKSNYGFAYTIPIYDPRKDRVSLIGKWELEFFDTTQTEAKYATVVYDHIREKGEYSVYLEFLDEDYEIGSDTGHATFLYPGIKTTWRWADDRLKTKHGFRITLDVAGASNEILSDTSFLQTFLNTKAITSFLDHWRLIGKFQFGWTLVDDVFDLSPSLRFYAGGDQSVRGFKYKTIGPKDLEGNVLGASHLITYSVELERLLFGNWSAALFFDSGDATNSLSDLEMHYGIGAGIRWNAPFGQVRLDVAKGVGEGESSWRIHFNLGADL